MHASYSSLGTQTCRVDNTSYQVSVVNPFNHNIKRMDRSSHLHRSTGTTRTARHCQPM